MAQTRRQALGNWGETQAAQFLLSKGYQLVARNARTAYGEIDLVMRDGSVLVFVEVKTRTSLQYGYPEQAVTGRKLDHMVAAAQAFVEDHPDLAGTGWRIDVVAVLRPAGRSGGSDSDVEVIHFEDVAG